MAAGESRGTTESAPDRRGEPLAKRALDEAHSAPAGGAERMRDAGRRAAGDAGRGVDEGDGGPARGACDDADAVESPQAGGGVGRFICRISHGTATIACRRPLARRAHLPAVERASAIALALRPLHAICTPMTAPLV